MNVGTKAMGNSFPTHVPVMQALDEFASLKKKKKAVLNFP